MSSFLGAFRFPCHVIFRSMQSYLRVLTKKSRKHHFTHWEFADLFIMLYVTVDFVLLKSNISTLRTYLILCNPQQYYYIILLTLDACFSNWSVYCCEGNGIHEKNHFKSVISIFLTNMDTIRVKGKSVWLFT